MKKYLTLFLLTAVIFGLLTTLTIKDERAFDGNYFCGFPFPFYTKYSEIVSTAPTNDMDMTRTNYLFLIFDILFAFLLSIIGLAVFKKFKNIFNKKQS